MNKIFTQHFLTKLMLKASDQDNPLWLRYPPISPDGNTILFSFTGDIYSVPSDGGLVVPLTLSVSYEFSHVWNHDGKSIAFASGRYGNFDVYAMPSGDREARHLTFHSGHEIPSSFTADNKNIYFTCDAETECCFKKREQS